MKRTLILAALALGACSSAPDLSHDYYGNVYPSDCPASIVSDPALTSRTIIVRAHVAGQYGSTTRAGNDFIVLLDPTLSGWMLDDVRHHEFCHVRHMADNNPDRGDWHGHFVPNVYRTPACANPFHC